MEITFAAWFREARKKRKQTQLEAAADLKLSGPTISRWENGGAPDAKHLERVREWGKISAARLLKIVAQ